jgi:uncharacterized protein (DUF58 family)
MNIIVNVVDDKLLANIHVLRERTVGITKLMRLIKKRSPKNPGQQAKLQLNLPLLPILVIILGILYILTNFRGWLIFFIGTGGAWLIAWLWARSIRKNLTVERKVNLAWATVGESVPEQVKLINNSWLPAVWVELTDDSPTLSSPLRMVSDVAPHAYRTRNLNHQFKRRGIYKLGPTHLRCGDPFGIYTISMDDPHTSIILITPPVLPLTQLKVPTGGWMGDERYRRGFIERNISPAGLRNYVPGDSLRRIHWRASAHFDTLIVRQLESATSRDWWIFVDLNEIDQAGEGEHSTLELSIVVAASLALRGLREYRKVGLVLAGPQFIWLEPSADVMQRWRILRALAMAKAGSHPLQDLLLQKPVSRAGTAIVITPSSNPTWVATVDRKRKGGSSMAVLVDPVNFGAKVSQSAVISALSQKRIPYVHIPGSLLGEAYSASNLARHRQITSAETGKRYIQQERPYWQSMG